jgi:RNA-directed DNA polymerase
LGNCCAISWNGNIIKEVWVTEYEKIYQFESLYRAYKATAKGKRNKKDVIDFELDLSSNLWKLHDELESRKYRLSGYHYFQIYDPKKRKIQALSIRDRIVQHSICDNILKPYFEPRLIYDNAACRVGKGTRFATDRLTEFMRAYYRQHGTKGYILKFDIRKFFDSINHNVLKQKLIGIEDDEVKELLFQIIDSISVNPDESDMRGLPLGNQTSQWFALWYLDGLDRMIKEQFGIRYYSRYMDDGIIIHENKEYLRQCLHQMEQYINEDLKLSFNEKTQIFPISQGADYLGFRFYLTDTGKVIKRLRTSNKKRWKRRLKLYQKQYKTGEKSFEDITRSMKSYEGHLRYGDTWRLRKQVYQNFVLTKSTDNPIQDTRNGRKDEHYEKEQI